MKEKKKETKTVMRQRKILSNNIQALLDSRGRTQTEMARDLNFAETTVSSWIRCERYPRIDRIQQMADYFNVRRSDITDEKPNNLKAISPLTVKVPVLGRISCGDPIYAEENFDGFRNESPDNLPSGNVFVLIAEGDSMEPTIPNGSDVLIREQSDVEYGEIAAVLINNDSEATLKRVRKQGDLIVLTPDNTDHEPIIVTEDNPARIIGKAVKFTINL